MKAARNSLLLVLLLAFPLQACFGKFALVRKVYNFNASIGDKFLRSLLTWVMIWIPVYSIAAFLDFVIFNLIEFWTGNNPVDSGKVSSVEKDGTVLTAHRSAEALEFTAAKDGIVQHRIVFRKADKTAMEAKVYQADGKLVEETIIPMTDVSAEHLAALQASAL